MTRKNLADVLLKILGVSIFLSALPSVIASLLLALESLHGTTVSQLVAMDRALAYTLTDGFRTVIGLVLLLKSRKISEYWYRNESE